MAAKRDYYEVLGVSRNADAGTIKKSIPEIGEKNIIRIPIQEINRQRNHLKK